jgi:hypothetical protein
LTALVDTGIGTEGPTGLSFAVLGAQATPLLASVHRHFTARLRSLGHRITGVPDTRTNAVFTSHRFGDVVDWRRAPLFTLRRRYGLAKTPPSVALVHATLDEFKATLARLRLAVNCAGAGCEWPGLLPGANRVLLEQGVRGGAILALIRLLQGQLKSLRIILVVGETRVRGAFHFDLVGAHPFARARDDEAGFYGDFVDRVLAAVQTRELTAHRQTLPAVSQQEWSRLESPVAVLRASREFGSRGLFTEMVRIADLVTVPAVSDALAAQYSEGCFGTWDPVLPGMLMTASGSGRPADKGNLTVFDLAVVAGIRADGLGALVRPVEGTPAVTPSSEAVEMLLVDEYLPRIELPWAGRVPVVRSKLHVHRGIRAFDARRIEHVALPQVSQQRLVSCATDAQAIAVAAAFRTARSLRDPADPRQLAFTVLPGHGIVVAEKWMRDKVPFQLIWEHLDAGALVIESRLPQGPHDYLDVGDHRMQIRRSCTPC